MTKQELAMPRTFEGGSEAVLLIHGYAGSPAQLLPMAQSIHENGYTVRALRLPGHGTKVQDMEQTTWDQWLNCARAEAQALRETHQKVHIMGLSMGGTIALLLAEEGLADSLVTMAAPVLLYNGFMLLARYAWPMVRRLFRGRSAKREGFLYEYNVGYSETPRHKIVDLAQLMRMAFDGLSKVTCPLLVVRAGQDHTVHAPNADAILNGCASPSKTLLELDRSAHVCTLDAQRDLLFETVVGFLHGTPVLAEQVG